MGMTTEIVFLERKHCALKRAVLEVKDALRIESLAHVACLEMEMRPCAAACATAIANEGTGANGVAHIDEVFLQVAIVGLNSVVVPDDNEIAIPAALFGGHDNTHHAIEGSIDAVANMQGDVNTLMGMSATILKLGENIPSRIRHAVTMQRIDQRNVDGIRQRFHVDAFDVDGFSVPKILIHCGIHHRKQRIFNEAGAVDLSRLHANRVA